MIDNNLSIDLFARRFLQEPEVHMWEHWRWYYAVHYVCELWWLSEAPIVLGRIYVYGISISEVTTDKRRYRGKMTAIGLERLSGCPVYRDCVIVTI